MRRLLMVFAVSILFLNVFLPVLSASADNGNDFPTYNPKLKVLEIVDIGESRIKKTLEETGSFIVETITMKQFVASREELDGKYDFIAISDGDYSTTTVKQVLDNRVSRSDAHKTTELMNDITNLKANEIISQFIEKGQPVILERHSVKNDGILNEKFGSYNGSDKNIIMYTHNGNSDSNYNTKCSWWDKLWGLCDNKKQNIESKQQDLLSHTENFLRDYHIPRPRFELSKKPEELNRQDEYGPGEHLEFQIKMLTSIERKDLKAILYIDTDFNDKYEPSEIVLEQPITTVNNTEIKYKLPRGYSGIRNWKLEVIDLGKNLKDYQKGSVYFKDEMVEIDVLQINKDTNKSSSLKDSKNMNQDFLAPQSGEYKINIDVTDMGTFGKSNGEYSHSSINGKYDMLIFGFADEYNKASINNNAVQSVEEFIRTNQSILFTHDTIFESNNNWVNNFMEDTGQKAPLTNLGYGAPNTSTKTQKINEGMMTKYPFNLGNNITIASTHNQYYTLDLEDPDVIPWYNITGNSRDPYDSYNHYYTYSKGNITYSGSGHTSTGFKPEEQELFVNTMYRAFLGSNHSPIITVESPEEEAIIPEHWKIPIKYTIEDFDLKDKSLQTKIYLNDEEVFSDNDVTNGTSIFYEVEHGIEDTSTNGSGTPATIRIEAIDENGAISEQNINIKIVKLSASLEVSRQLSTNNILPVEDSVTMNYVLKPKDISLEVGDVLGEDKNVLTDIKFSETFPVNMDVQVPEGFTKTGTIETGITVTANLPEIRYVRNDGKYSATPLTFGITVTPKKMGDFSLGNSTLSYLDINGQNENPPFNPVTIRSKYKIEGIELPDNMVINKNIPENLNLKLKVYPDIVHANEIVKDTHWSVQSSDDVFTIEPKLGTLTAKDVGEGYVTVRVTDHFGNVFEERMLVTVRIPVESISFDSDSITLKVDESKTLPVMVNPPEAKNVVTIELLDPSLATVNKDNWTVTGKKPGQTRIIVRGIDKDGNVLEASATLIVEEILITKINAPSEVSINIGEKYNVEASFEPENATNKKLIWSSQNSTIARVEDGRIEGVSTGVTYIDIRADKGNATATIKVTVGAPLKEISAPEVLKLEIGSRQTLYDPKKGNDTNLLKIYPRDATNIEEPSFSSLNGPIAHLERSDSVISVIANRIGESVITIRIKAHQEDSEYETHEVKIKIKVVPEGEQGSGGSDSDDDLY